MSSLLEELKSTVDMLRRKYISSGVGKRALMRILYYDIMLILIHNGLRVNEVRLCLKEWSKTYSRVVTIYALKTHKRSYRKCYIPEEISDLELHTIIKIFPIDNPERFRHMVYQFIKYNFGINPRTIRKMFIDYMLDMGYSPSKVAKALGLMKIRTLESYAHKRFIDKIRREHRRREKLKQLLEGVASEEE